MVFHSPLPLSPSRRPCLGVEFQVDVPTALDLGSALVLLVEGRGRGGLDQSSGCLARLRFEEPGCVEEAGCV